MFARATTRDDDDGDDGDARAPLERFVSEHPSVYGERVVARLSDAELLMARCASRAMRRATNAAAPERAKTLHRVRLFEDDARVDVTHPVRADDPMEIWWRKVSAGRLGRWGLSLGAETMLGTIARPPRGRGDAHVKHRLRYLRERLRCDWDARVTEACLERGYLGSFAYCCDNGCPATRRPPAKQTWLLERGADPEEWFAWLKKEFERDGDAKLYDVAIDERTNRIVKVGCADDEDDRGDDRGDDRPRSPAETSDAMNFEDVFKKFDMK